MSGKEQQETYKEFSEEMPIVSKEKLARLIKTKYPVYGDLDDTTFVNKVLEKYSQDKKYFEHKDTLKLKMELVKIDIPKCNSCYEIYWRAERTLNINIFTITEIIFLSQNKVKLFNLCDNCKWERTNENIVTSQKTIESIDVWNKLNIISYTISLSEQIDQNSTQSSKRGVANEIYIVNEFGEEMIFDPKTGDFILKSKE